MIRAWLGLAFLICGCARLDFAMAERYRKTGRYEAALQSYVRLAESTPKNRLAPEALFQAGKIASDVMADYPLARDLFERLINRYGGMGDWGTRTERALFNAPNYFPLLPNAVWVEGDSQTGGRNARIEITCRTRENEGGVVFTRQYYAGKQIVKSLSTNRFYEKENLELRERGEGKSNHTVMLKYPFTKGERWTSIRDGRKFLFRIEGTATVRVQAGEFKDCLMVREQPEGITTSWKVDYYAPGIGKVLTTLATERTEERNTELLSYNLGTNEEIE